MKKEDIKKAAINYREILTYNPKDMYDDEKSFIVGAEWRINSVWHNVSEKPKKGEMILALRSKYSPIICGPFNFDWKETVEEFSLKKWAYVEDLIHDTEE